MENKNNLINKVLLGKYQTLYETTKQIKINTEEIDATFEAKACLIEISGWHGIIVILDYGQEKIIGFPMESHTALNPVPQIISIYSLLGTVNINQYRKEITEIVKKCRVYAQDEYEEEIYFEQFRKKSLTM